jgi:hypothetical protein
MDNATDVTGKVTAVRADASCSSAAIEFSECIVILAGSRDTVNTDGRIRK